MERIRRARVAGSFYENSRKALKEQIKNCFLHKVGPKKLPQEESSDGLEKKERKIIGVVSPHAGFMYSGPVAAHDYLALSYEKAPETIVILGPNHSGLGEDISLMSEGFWETPLGKVEIETELAKNIIKNDHHHIIKEDQKAHFLEHSIEVQLPFLQYIYSDRFTIIPISIKNQRIELMKYLAHILHDTVKDKLSLFIASSDFTHYESQQIAQQKDHEAIQAITKEMNTDHFYETIKSNKATICGPGPISVVMETCHLMGIKQGNLLKYATSGEISGLYDQVVGYASIIFKDS